MKYTYGEYDGEEFPTQDKLFGFDRLNLAHAGDDAITAAGGDRAG